MFNKLAPFIQEYIYRNNWTELRDFQEEACRVIFDTDLHLLLSSATASGKTEAAFLPALTEIYNSSQKSVGILYICPLKALINDQFLRINELCAEGGIKVTHWHGDVPQHKKNKLLQDPRGVLQITPESLESMLINKMTQINGLFSDLRFVIIDEVHSFMNSDRGLQVLSLLIRLERFTNVHPRRIGLSATLGDSSMAAKWLGMGTTRNVATPESAPSGKSIKLSVQHYSTFFLKDEDAFSDENRTEAEIDKDNSTALEHFYNYTYDQSHEFKSLIFTNARIDAELCAKYMKDIASARGEPDVFHVHHGSIAALLRETAESTMRSVNQAVTVATVTLELGIDIGRLQRVLQLDSPSSVSSFVQRLGRSGRRGDVPEMYFVTMEKETERPLAPELIPWNLIQNIAIIQLYLEERFVEPLRIKKYPLSLLYHQTMSTLKILGETDPEALCDRMLNIDIFNKIDRKDFMEMISHLIETQHLEHIEDGGVIIGMEGERIVNSYKFYAVFKDEEEYMVKYKSKEIGTIQVFPPVGISFALAGSSWNVIEIDMKKKVVYVVPTRGKVVDAWTSGKVEIHIKILQRMKKVLDEDTEYRYLAENAKKRLRLARRTVQNTKLTSKLVIPMGGDFYCILPWCGTREYYTLVRYVKRNMGDIINVAKIRQASPYYMIVEAACDQHELTDRLSRICEAEIEPLSLINENVQLRHEKYDEYLPDSLLMKSVAYDYISVDMLRWAIKKALN